MISFQDVESDVGVWNAFTESIDADGDNKRIRGGGKAHHASSTHVHASHRFVAALKIG